MNKNLADYIYTQISPVTSKYIENLNISSETFAEALKVGKLSLKQLKITNEFLLVLNHILMPTLKLNLIEVGELTINIPQLTNIMKNSVEIEVKNIKVLAEIPYIKQQDDDVQFLLKNYMEEIYLKKKLDLIEFLKKEIPSNIEKKNSNSFFTLDYSTLIMTIIDNFIIKISDLEIEISEFFKIKLGNAEYLTTDNKYQYTFGKYNKDNYLGYKMIKINNFQVNDTLLTIHQAQVRMKIQSGHAKTNSRNKNFECDLDISRHGINLTKEDFFKFEEISENYRYIKNYLKIFDILKSNLIYHPDILQKYNGINIPQLQYADINTNELPKFNKNILRWRYAIKCVIDINKTRKAEDKKVKKVMNILNIPEEESYCILNQEFIKFFPLIKSSHDLNSKNSEELENFKFLLRVLDQVRISEWIKPLIEEIILDSKSKSENKGFFNLFGGFGSQKSDNNIKKTNIQILSIEEKEDVTKHIRDIVNPVTQQVTGEINFKIKAEINQFEFNLYSENNSKIMLNLNCLNLSVMNSTSKINNTNINFSLSAECKIKSISATLVTNLLANNLSSQFEIIKENKILNDKNQASSVFLDFSYKNNLDIPDQKNFKLNAILERFDIEFNLEIIKFFISFSNFKSERKILKIRETNLLNINSTNESKVSFKDLNESKFTFEVNLSMKSRQIFMPFLISDDSTGYIESSMQKLNYLSIITNDCEIKLDRNIDNYVDFKIFAGINKIKSIKKTKSSIKTLSQNDVDNSNKCQNINDKSDENLSDNDLIVLENLNIGITFSLNPKSKSFLIKFTQGPPLNTTNSSKSNDSFTFYLTKDLFELINNITDYIQITFTHSDKNQIHLKQLEDNSMIIDTHIENYQNLTQYKKILNQDFEFASSFEFKDLNLVVNLSEYTSAIFKATSLNTELMIGNSLEFNSQLRIQLELNKIEALFRDNYEEYEFEINKNIDKNIDMDIDINNCNHHNDFVFLTTACESKKFFLSNIEIIKDKSSSIEAKIEDIIFNYDGLKYRQMVGKIYEIFSTNKSLLNKNEDKALLIPHKSNEMKKTNMSYTIDQNILKTFSNFHLKFTLQKLILNISDTDELTQYQLVNKDFLINAEKFENDYSLNFEISKMFFYDMTDYPYNKNATISKNILFSLEKNLKMNLLFSYLSNQSRLRLNFHLSNPYLNFIKQPIERFIKFIQKDIKLWQEEFSKKNPSIYPPNFTNIKDVQNTLNNKRYLDYIDKTYYENSYLENLKFIFEINLDNIIVQIKADQRLENSFELDFGKIKIFNENEAEKENKTGIQGAIKNTRSLFKVNFNCQAFHVRSILKPEDKFFILRPSNLNFVIYILNDENPSAFSEEEIENFNSLVKSVNCEMKMDKYELNFRQKDLNYLIQCIEMNFNNEDVIKKQKKSKKTMLTSGKLQPKHNNFAKLNKLNVSLDTTEIKINLLEKEKTNPLTSLILNNLRLNIQSNADLHSNLTDENISNTNITTLITFKIKLIEIYFFHKFKENLTKRYELIMGYNFDVDLEETISDGTMTDQNIEIFENSKDQVDLSITINSKDVINTKVKLELNHLKFNPRLDFIILIKTFIQESMPNLKPNQLNNNSIKSKGNIKIIQSELEILLKNTLFTLSIDDNCSRKNKNQAVIGLQIKLIKIINMNKDTNTIRTTLEQIKSLTYDSVEINNLTLKENFADIFVEVMNIDVYTYLGDGIDNPYDFITNRRYIIKQYLNESILVIKSSLYLHFNEKFEIRESLHTVTELHRLQIKLSYKDILSLVKVANRIYFEINSEKFKERIEGLKFDNNYPDVQFYQSEINDNSLKIEKFEDYNDMLIDDINYKYSHKLNQYDDLPLLPLENMHILFNGFKISVILIDDQAYVYYPFLTINIDNLNNSLLIRNGEKKIKSITLTEIEVLSHNYIAGEWEPVVENLRAEITYSREELYESLNSNTVFDKISNNKNIELSNLNINKLKDNTIKSNLILNFPANLTSPVNINLSDMNISFIYSNMSSWMEKLLKEFEIYNQNNITNKTNQVDPELFRTQKIATVISNHKIKNLTGRNLFINNGDKLKSLLKIDAYLDLEYIPANEQKKKNTVTFSNDKDSPESHIIYIDQLGAQFHTINFNLPFNNLKQSNNSYLISEVTSLNKKKLITIYSPIVFYNKTDTSLLLNLINYDPLTKQNVEYILVLGQREKQAVPYEFLTANYELHNASTFKKSQSYKLRDILDSQEYYYNEVVVGSSIYNLSRNVKKSLKNVREIKITASYTIVNCLPCDLKITFPHNKEKYIIKKSERKYIDILSLKNSLNVILEVCEFHTARGSGVILYDNFNLSEENKGDKIKFIKLERIVGNHNNTNINKESMVNSDGAMTNAFLNNVLVLSYCVLKNKLLQNREIVIYSSNVIINNTGLPELKLFYDPKREISKYKSDAINSENYIFLYNNNPNEDTKFFLQINSVQSSYVDIGNVKGNSNVAVQCYNKNMFYEFIIQASMSNLPSLKYDTELYSNLFTIKPSVIIHNNLDIYKICICLNSDQIIYDIIPNMDSAPFYFFGNYSGKSSPICIKPIVFDENMNEIGGSFEWSQPFVISNRRGLFTIPIKIVNEKNNIFSNEQNFMKKMYLNCEIKEEDLITHLEISLADYQNSQFIIENNLKSNSNDKSYVIKVSQENFEKVNTDFIVEGKYIIYSLYDYFNYNSTKHNTNVNKMIFEIFEVDKNIANEHDGFILNEILFPNKQHSILAKSKFKFHIFEDGIKKEIVSDLSHNIVNQLYPYPHHHDDIIPPNTKIKILFLSSGIKKTIKFIDKSSESKKHDETSTNKHLENSIKSNSKYIFNFELFIEKLSISIISDNLSRDKKLRNYCRNEIIHIYIYSITSTYKNETFNSDENFDNSELNFSIFDLQLDNQISRYAKYPNVLTVQKEEIIVQHSDKIPFVPFFNLSLFSQINKKDKMSTIKFLTYNIQPIKIGIDVEFIEAILMFLNNLFYQLNTSYLEINEIFKLQSGDGIKISKGLNGTTSSFYKHSDYKYYANILESSNVTIFISICEKGFKEFLYRHLNIGSLIASVINNLTVVEETKIQLNGEVINYFMGSIMDIFTKIYIGYQQKFISKLFSIGAKGLFLGIIKIFSKEQTVPEIEPFMRIKMPRAFYGKFRHIKKYEPLHAYICDLVRREKIQIFQNFELNFYNSEVFKISNQTKEEVCLIFTTTNFILINMFNLMPFYIVDYYSIRSVRMEPGRTQNEYQVLVEFNQTIDGVKILN